MLAVPSSGTFDNRINYQTKRHDVCLEKQERLAPLNANNWIEMLQSRKTNDRWKSCLGSKGKFRDR